jgi:hypothetical protein
VEKLKTLSSGTRDGRGNEHFFVGSVETTSGELMLQRFIPVGKAEMPM